MHLRKNRYARAYRPESAPLFDPRRPGKDVLGNGDGVAAVYGSNSQPFFFYSFSFSQRYLAKTCWGPQMEGLLFLEVSFVTAECVLRDCSRQVLNPKPKPWILDLKP